MNLAAFLKIKKIFFFKDALIDMIDVQNGPKLVNAKQMSDSCCHTAVLPAKMEVCYS